MPPSSHTDGPSDWPEVSRQIWDAKYRLKQPDGTPLDQTLPDTWARVARAAASVERRSRRERHETAFAEAMSDFAFLPAGRILAGAGSGRDVTLFNCFVMGTIEDDLSSIFENVREAALTMQQGGGIGHDFSTLRPKGALVRSVGADASGPVSFMNVWDSMCRTIMSAGQRRGAMMATLRCDHPDIEIFIDAKRDPAALRNFNLSVLVTDAFIAAIRDDAPWPLVFAGKVYRTVRARALWDRIMRATYDYAEPGVIFIDRINAENNLAYCETINATNPCGEQPLPPYGACLLGSVNLARLVERAFTPEAGLDEARLVRLVATATRFLDNVIDVSGYPLAAQRKEARAKRRIGLGLTGLADALIMCGLDYGSDAGRQAAGRWMGTIKEAAYAASAALADEKGAFPSCEVAALIDRPSIKALPKAIRRDIEKGGLRNGLLTSIAPTGTISLLAGNVSSGIEPVFEAAYTRRVRTPDGGTREVEVVDHAVVRHRALFGASAPLPAVLRTAFDLPPHAHLAMQAAIQRHVDSSISKTINCPENMSFEAFKDIYLEAYALGLKGCTTYRPNPVTGAVLVAPSAAQPVVAASAPAAAPALPVQVPVPVPAAASVTVTVPVAAAPARPPAGEGDRDGVVYLTQPLARDLVLSGSTYKLKWPDSDHAMYITINDIERDGRRRPFEIFINSKNLEHYAWTLALTRMISAVFRRGGDVTFVVEELKAVFDPRGGQWMDGRYVPSLLAAIGNVIETHFRRIGLASTGATLEARVPERARSAADDQGPAQIASPASATPADGAGAAASGSARTRLQSFCPRCGQRAWSRQEGCWTCTACGFSKCD
jgi:ribonucleoside-diphosphate reductase alpha chain